MALLIMVILASGIYYLENLFFKKNWKKGLDVTMRFSKKAITVNEPCRLIETITNNKRLPLLSMEVKFSASNDIVFEDQRNASVTDQNYRRDFFHCAAYEQIIRTLDFTVTKRGYYTIPKTNVLVKDFFLLKQFVENFENETSLYVYPQKISYTRLQEFYEKQLDQTVSARRLEEDPFAFRGMRDYMPSDPIRIINQKASAHADRMLVNLFDSTSALKICILLDGTNCAAFDGEILQEYAICLASSYALFFLQKGFSVSMFSNGYDSLTMESMFVPFGSFKGHMESIDRNLARLEFPANSRKEEATSLDQLFARANAYCSKDTMYLLISSEKYRNLVSFMEAEDRMDDAIKQHPLHVIQPFTMKDATTILSGYKEHPNYHHIIKPWEVIE